MSEKKVKRLSQTITKEIVIEEINKQENKNKHVSVAKRPQRVSKADAVQRNKSPENNHCCGIFNCCSTNNNINGNNNNVNTDKTIDTKADVNVGLK